MSLKAFHIVFIIFSTLLAVGIGVWCLWVNLVEGTPIYVAGAVAFLCSPDGQMVRGHTLIVDGGFSLLA